MDVKIYTLETSTRYLSPDSKLQICKLVHGFDHTLITEDGNHLNIRIDGLTCDLVRKIEHIIKHDQSYLDN